MWNNSYLDKKELKLQMKYPETPECEIIVLKISQSMIST